MQSPMLPSLSQVCWVFGLAYLFELFVKEGLKMLHSGCRQHTAAHRARLRGAAQCSSLQQQCSSQS